MKRILIADDSEMARMFVRRCIEMAGIREVEFLEGEDGEKALSLLRSAPADLVVTDLNMPNMNGLDLLRRIKASPRLNHIPVLVISSSTDPKKREELEELGVFGILSKPVSPSSIASVLGPLMETT